MINLRRLHRMYKQQQYKIKWKKAINKLYSWHSSPTYNNYDDSEYRFRGYLNDQFT